MDPVQVPFTTTHDAGGSDDVLKSIESALYPEPKAADPVDPDPVDPDPVDPDPVDPDPVDPDPVDPDPVDPVDPDPVDPDDDDPADPDPADPDDDALELAPEQFAQALGIDPKHIFVEEDGSVKLKTIVDGVEGVVDFKDAIRSIQTEASQTRKSQAIAEQRKAFDQEVAEQSAAIKQRVTEAAAVVHALESQLTSDYNSINWDQLKQSDPNTYVIKRQEFQDRVTQINGMKGRALEVLQAQAQDFQQKTQAQRDEYLAAEAQALSTKLPEWGNPETLPKKRNELSSFIQEYYGYDPGDLDRVEDHRLILLATDAMKYRQGKKAAEAAVKKVKALPQIQKPGARRANSTQAALAERQKQKMIRLKKTGSTDDLVAVLADRM